MDTLYFKPGGRARKPKVSDLSKSKLPSEAATAEDVAEALSQPPHEPTDSSIHWVTLFHDSQELRSMAQYLCFHKRLIESIQYSRIGGMLLIVWNTSYQATESIITKRIRKLSGISPCLWLRRRHSGMSTVKVDRLLRGGCCLDTAAGPRKVLLAPAKTYYRSDVHYLQGEAAV